MVMDAERHDAAARAIWGAWSGHTLIDGLPEACRPGTLAEGYAVQAALARIAGARPVGWKIAATSAAGQKHIGVDGPLAGRLWESKLHASGVHAAGGPPPHGGGRGGVRVPPGPGPARRRRRLRGGRGHGGGRGTASRHRDSGFALQRLHRRRRRPARRRQWLHRILRARPGGAAGLAGAGPRRPSRRGLHRRRGSGASGTGCAPGEPAHRHGHGLRANGVRGTSGDPRIALTWLARWQRPISRCATAPLGRPATWSSPAPASCRRRSGMPGRRGPTSARSHGRGGAGLVLERVHKTSDNGTIQVTDSFHLLSTRRADSKRRLDKLQSKIIRFILCAISHQSFFAIYVTGSFGRPLEGRISDPSFLYTQWELRTSQ